MRGKFRPDKYVQDYLPDTKGTVCRSAADAGCTHAHQAGLTPWIPFYKQTLLADGSLDPRYYNQAKIPGFTTKVADNIYMRDDYRDSIWAQITQTPLKTKGHINSDLTMYIGKRIVEQLSGMTLDEYVYRNFYTPLGMERTCYNPLERFQKKRSFLLRMITYFPLPDHCMATCTTWVQP